MRFVHFILYARLFDNTNQLHHPTKCQSGMATCAATVVKECCYFTFFWIFLMKGYLVGVCVLLLNVPELLLWEFLLTRLWLMRGG